VRSGTTRRRRTRRAQSPPRRRRRRTRGAQPCAQTVSKAGPHAKGRTRRGDAELEEFSRRPAASDAELGELRRAHFATKPRRAAASPSKWSERRSRARGRTKCHRLRGSAADLEEVSRAKPGPPRRRPRRGVPCAGEPGEAKSTNTKAHTKRNHAHT
jgi:hypothetical protein